MPDAALAMASAKSARTLVTPEGVALNLQLALAGQRISAFLLDLMFMIGALLILSAYILVSLGKVAADSVAFQLLNIVGAAGFIVNGWWHGAIPSAVLNVIWMGIGLAALWRMRRSSTSAT